MICLKSELRLAVEKSGGGRAEVLTGRVEEGRRSGICNGPKVICRPFDSVL